MQKILLKNICILFAGKINNDNNNAIIVVVVIIIIMIVIDDYLIEF